ncbi:MAG: FAD-dependent monooxygenase [Phycisphaerales bacterium]|nr:FAD-dependent monooxygenase [Phycisphaerales bacterium]
MTTANDSRFIIVGAGLAGTLMAVYLGRAGFKVDVHEKRPDLRKTDAGPQKSINLALSARGIHALSLAGLTDEVLDGAVRMPGRMLHAPDGSLAFQPYSKNPADAINSVSRARLNITMLNAAEASPNVRLFFEQRCVDADLDRGVAHLHNDRTGETRDSEPGIIIGADGAFSTVRARMQRLERFSYSQDYLDHGYKELTIPPDDTGRHRMNPNALHIWPRRSFMMIALPNRDGSFTCTLFWPFRGPFGFDNLRTPAEIERFFGDHFPDTVPLMPTLVDDYRRNPIGTLVTIRCAPWHVNDRAVLIGDAAHAIVPFYGQGINAGFEDCVALLDAIRGRPDDLSAAFDAYFRARKVNSDTIADLAVENFIEMRDRTGSPAFLRKKKIERWLDRLLPGYVPLYSLVSFSRVPYAEAVDRVRRQDRRVRLAFWTIAAFCAIIVAMFVTYLV